MDFKNHVSGTFSIWSTWIVLLIVDVGLHCLSVDWVIKLCLLLYQYVYFKACISRSPMRRNVSLMYLVCVRSKFARHLNNHYENRHRSLWLTNTFVNTALNSIGAYVRSNILTRGRYRATYRFIRYPRLILSRGRNDVHRYEYFHSQNGFVG